MTQIILGLSIVSLWIWIYLLGFRGQFWRMDQRLSEGDKSASVCVVIPARNEADLLPLTLRSLFTQEYSGVLNVILVDDHSTDDTAKAARETAESLEKVDRLEILAAEPLPIGWTGKLWALEQGIQHGMGLQPDYFLLTDADIQHDADNVQNLVSKAIEDDRELVSLMVRLRCVSFWEKLLIPAFVFFFAKLYPFQWANDPNRSLAAAAGGCSLIQREALTRIGGVGAIRQALIDDCALADAIKSTGSRRIWLGLTPTTISLRPYDSLDTIWSMVSRTAYTQLNYSPVLLIGAVFGMLIVYLFPVIGMLTGNIIGWFTYLLMTLAYFPIVQFYRCSFWYALCLPAIALLYLFMTLDSALKHWQGQGGEWKGRTYEKS